MSSTKNPQSGGIFDRLSKSDTYASSKMKSAARPVKSKKDPQDPSPKGKTSSSFFDRMSKTETYATAQTRKVNRTANDGTFAEASKGALQRDIKGGTYFRSKMDPKEERKRDGTGPVRKSTTAAWWSCQIIYHKNLKGYLDYTTVRFSPYNPCVYKKIDINYQ